MADLACTQCTVLKGFPCIQCTVHNSAWAVAMHSVHSACQILRYSVQLDSALCILCVVGSFTARSFVPHFGQRISTACVMYGAEGILKGVRKKSHDRLRRAAACA